MLGTMQDDDELSSMSLQMPYLKGLKYKLLDQWFNMPSEAL